MVEKIRIKLNVQRGDTFKVTLHLLLLYSELDRANQSYLENLYDGL